MEGVGGNSLIGCFIEMNDNCQIRINSPQNRIMSNHFWRASSAPGNGIYINWVSNSGPQDGNTIIGNWFNNPNGAINQDLFQSNVGIGTTSPNSSLQVNGNVAIGYSNSAPPNGLIVSGNVGIGQSNPQVPLDINHVAWIRDSNSGLIFCTQAGQNYIESSSAGMTGSADLNFTNAYAGNTWMTIKNSGNMGIGTVNPDTKLHVNGAITLGGTGGPQIISGSGAPSAALPNGSIYINTSGGSNSTLYVRVAGQWMNIR